LGSKEYSGKGAKEDDSEEYDQQLVDILLFLLEIVITLACLLVTIFYIYFIFVSAHSITKKKITKFKCIALWEGISVGTVITSEHTIDVKQSCPCSSNGHFHSLMRVKVVHTFFFTLQQPFSPNATLFLSYLLSV